MTAKVRFFIAGICLIQVSQTLKPGGFFYASFKYIVYECVMNGRYFTDLIEAGFANLFAGFPEFETIETRITSEEGPERERLRNGLMW